MKRKVLGTAIVFLSLLAGCYFPESLETRIIFDKNQPVVVIKYHNISTSSDDPEEFKESFDGLIEDMYGDKYLVDRASEGLAIRKRQLFVQNGKLQAEVVGDANNLNNIYAFYASHDERFMVYDDQDSYELVETNGKIVKTARNTLIVWPAEMKEIYWRERLIMEKEDEEDIATFYKNMPKMVAMFREYEKKNKIE